MGALTYDEMKLEQIQAILIIGVFMLGSFSQLAHAQNTISVTTSKKLYNEGDTVVISGQVSTIEPDTPVTILLLYGNSMVNVVQIKVGPSGKFTHSVLAQGPLWQNDGTYTVRASYGPELMKETRFGFKTAPEQEPEPTNETPTPEPPKTAPDFIDPQKGAQYYLDRYYNEPAFKEWFDTYYPDYTIEEAIELAIPDSMREGSTVDNSTNPDENDTASSKLPEWIRNIFIWYAEEKISEDELLQAIQFLLDNGILKK